MNSRTLRRVIAALVICCLSDSAYAAPLELDAALDPAGTMSASLSPDGKHIVTTIFNGTNYGLVLYDTATMSARLLKVGRRVTEGFWTFNKAPRGVRWVGNDLLAIDYGVEAESVRLDGKMVAELGEEVIGAAERNKPDSPYLLVYTDVKDGAIAKVNARTGDTEKFHYPRGKAIKWAFDRQGQLRAVTLVNSEFWKDVSLVSNWYRKSADAEWEKLAEFKLTDDYWVPLYVPDEAGKLVISSRAGRDTYALFSYDTATRSIGEMIAGHPTQDILAVSGIDQSAVERVETTGMVPQLVWFDPAWAAVQQAVDRVLPHRINRLSGNPKDKVLVRSTADIDPGSWYLVDMHDNTVTFVASVKPTVAVEEQRPMQVIQYKASDGLTIPAFLTLPVGDGKPAPTIVLIHGGPTARDYWGWNSEVQLLAAHGYAVFQPQFRGSSGFGRKFEEAGFGQWGLAMQDDITSGVEYLIQRGIADPGRICIVGASYGGYAALWGLVKTPQLYRCGVSFAGVTDIEYMLDDSSDRTKSKVGREYMRARLGDPAVNKEQFDSVSPLKHADRIQAPVLLMHGEEDERVPISHGKKMKRALEDQGKTVIWHSFEEEGHGFFYVRDEVTYFQTMFAFLDKYLASPVVKKAAPSAAAPAHAFATDLGATPGGSPNKASQ